MRPWSTRAEYCPLQRGQSEILLLSPGADIRLLLRSLDQSIPWLEAGIASHQLRPADRLPMK